MVTMKDRNVRDLVDAEEIKKRQKEYTEELVQKKILMNWITTMVYSVTQSQTGSPQETLLLIKLLDAIELQQSYSKP